MKVEYKPAYDPHLRYLVPFFNKIGIMYDSSNWESTEEKGIRLGAALHDCTKAPEKDLDKKIRSQVVRKVKGLHGRYLRRNGSLGVGMGRYVADSIWNIYDKEMTRDVWQMYWLNVTVQSRLYEEQLSMDDYHKIQREQLNKARNKDLQELRSEVLDELRPMFYNEETGLWGGAVGISIKDMDGEGNNPMKPRRELRQQSLFGITHPDRHITCMLEGVTYSKRDIYRIINFEEKINDVGFDPFHARDKVDILYQLGLGLEDLARMGVIHRDIKPDNVLISPEGIAKWTDFGFIRVDSMYDYVTKTIEGVTLGTLVYMAPEQAVSKTLPSSDIYAFGATAYDAITDGIPPINFPSKFTGMDQFMLVIQKETLSYNGRPYDPQFLARGASREEQEIARRIKPILAGCMAPPCTKYRDYQKIKIDDLEKILARVRYEDASVLAKDLELIKNGEDPKYIFLQWREKGVDPDQVFNQVFQKVVPFQPSGPQAVIRTEQGMEVGSEEYVKAETSEVLTNTVPTDSEAVTDEYTLAMRLAVNNELTNHKKSEDKPKRSKLGCAVKGLLLGTALAGAVYLADQEYHFLEPTKQKVEQVIKKLRNY